MLLLKSYRREDVNAIKGRPLKIVEERPEEDDQTVVPKLKNDETNLSGVLSPTSAKEQMKDIGTSYKYRSMDHLEEEVDQANARYMKKSISAKTDSFNFKKTGLHDVRPRVNSESPFENIQNSDNE